MSSPHVATWFGSFSVRFTGVPVGVFWKRLVSPYKFAQVCVPLQSDPNLFRRRGVFINQVQNKLVFFIAVDLHKIPPLCFCSTFEHLANFWLRYSQSNSSFWNASSHWGRDLYWWWKNGIVYCLLLYYKVQKLWSENTKIKIPENEENESVPYQLFEKRYQWHLSCVYYLTELKKKLNPQLKITSWEKIFF